MAWTTWLMTVYNNTPYPIGWIDIETKGSIWPGTIKGEIDGGHNENFNKANHGGGIATPWCQNSYEIATKAIHFGLIILAEGTKAPSEGTTRELDAPGSPKVDYYEGGFYLFQNYLDNTLYWCLSPPTGPTWDSIQSCKEGPANRVNIQIGWDAQAGFIILAQAVG